MWYIGQVVRNPAGERFIYAGFDLKQKICFSFFKLEKEGLTKFRDGAKGYKELPGSPIPIGAFARTLGAGFFGELDLTDLKLKGLYDLALETLEEST